MFQCQTFKDYLHLYLLCDVLHLSDIFERFRDKCVDDFQLDPAHYFSRPHFTYDAFLHHYGIQLELLTDVNQYFFLEKGIRGGLSIVAKRYSKDNNPHVLGYDSSRPRFTLSTWILIIYMGKPCKIIRHMEASDG